MLDDEEIFSQNNDGFQTRELSRQAKAWDKDCQKKSILKITSARSDYINYVQSQKINALRALDTLARKLGKEREINHNTYGLNKK